MRIARTTARGLGVVASISAITVFGPSAASYAAVASVAVPVASVTPGADQVVGVGHPVIVRFAAPVADRAAAERSIHVLPPEHITGTFSWAGDDEVQWIPDRFWPAHSTVTVKARGMSTQFQTGDAVVGVASISSHTFTVSQNEEVLRVMPASMGKPKRPTPVGSFTALSKERTIKFDSRTIGIPLNDPEGYLLNGEYAVRVTWGGVYVHSAPWSVDSQGYSNVSHGCINLSPANAAWYFDLVHIGDPIIVQS